jgi:hypothetical protein
MPSLRRPSRSLSLTIGISTAVLLTSIAQAQWWAGRFNGTGTSIDDGENTNRNNVLVASGFYNEANWQDNGGTGGPNDFGSDNNIPGDILGVDENDWSMVASGYLHVQNGGNYVFTTGSDDSSRVVIDGRNVVVQGGCCANVSGPSIPLLAGSTHFIQVTVKEGGGGGNAEFSFSLNGGARQLLSATGTDAFVNQVGILSLSGAGPSMPGLRGKYYPTNSPTVMNNQNLSVDTFLASNPTPTGTFVSTTVNYHGGDTSVTAHLGADAVTLSAGGGNSTTDSLFTFDGFIDIKATDDIDPSLAGIQIKFAFGSDDNSRLTIGGMVVVENDGPHGFPHFVTGNTDLLSQGTGDNAGGTAVVSFPNAGLYSLSAFYHNQGGGDDGQLYSSIGVAGGGVDTVPGSRLYQVPEPASLGMLGLGGLLLGAVRRRRSK